MSCVLLYCSVVRYGLCQQLQCSIASVVCCHWQCRYYKGICWMGNCQYWCRCGEDQCGVMFRQECCSNAQLTVKFEMILKSHNYSPPSFLLNLEGKENISLHHFRYTVTRYRWCTVYILHLKPLLLPSAVVWITCTGCSNSNCTIIILRLEGHIALFRADEQQRVVRRCSSSWSCYSPCLMYTEL